MHNALFSMKRAFHKSSWFGRALLGGYELTPSRFDLLYVVRTCPHSVIWQSAIRRILGVTAATTSVMVRALVKLGLVERKKSEEDRRQLEVSLTARGLALIERAMAALQTKEIVDYFVKRIVSPCCWQEERARDDVDLFEDTMYGIRRRLGDRAWLAYGAHPDD